jgi:hypothetical protein
LSQYRIKNYLLFNDFIMIHIPQEILKRIYEELLSVEDKCAFAKVCREWGESARCSVLCCGEAPCKWIMREASAAEYMREWEDNQEDDLYDRIM